jgi:tetratricopeptide (TPR) repeat protein
MRIRHGFLAVAFFVAMPAAAQTGDRWPIPPGTLDAFRAKDFAKARAQLETALKQCEASRPSGAQCIELLRALSAVADGMSDAPAAESYAQRAIALAARTLPPDHPDAALSHAFLAQHFDTVKRHAEAEAAYCSAIAIWHRATPTHKDRLSSTYRYLAEVVRAQGRGDEAAVYDARGGEVGGGYGPSEAASIADNAGKTAFVMEQGGQLSEAEPFARRAVAFRRCVAPDQTAQLANDLFLYGRLLANLGRDGDAEVALRAALAVPGGVKGDDLAGLYGVLGEVLLARTSLVEGERMFREALALRRDAQPPDTRAIARVLAGLSRLLQFQARYAEAEAAAREVLDLRLEAERSNDPAVFNAYGDLANVLALQGKFAEAEAIFRLLTAQAERNPSISQIRLTLNHAAILGEAGRLDEAEVLLRRAVALAPGVDPRDSSAPAAYYNLASTLARRGKDAEAIGYFRKALAWHEARATPDPLTVSTINLYMAISLAATGDRAGAETAFRRADSLRAPLFPASSHVARIDANWRLAAFLSSGGQLAEARTWFGTAQRGLLERMRSYPDFGPAVQRELRSYRPLFAGQIATAWRLSQR